MFFFLWNSSLHHCNHYKFSDCELCFLHLKFIFCAWVSWFSFDALKFSWDFQFTVGDIRNEKLLCFYLCGIFSFADDQFWACSFFFWGFNSVFTFYEHFSSGVYFYSFRDSSVESKGIVILLLLVGGKWLHVNCTGKKVSSFWIIGQGFNSDDYFAGFNLLSWKWGTGYRYRVYFAWV